MIFPKVFSRRDLLFLSLLFFLIDRSPLGAQESLSLSSYKKAKEVLEQAIEASGGLERMKSVNTISVDWAGTLYWNQRQSQRPYPPYDTWADTWHFSADLVEDRSRFSGIWQLPGGIRFNSCSIEKGNDLIVLNLNDSTYTSVYPTLRKNLLLRRFPYYILLKAFEQRASLRYIENGDSQQVLSFARNNGSVSYLYFNAEHLLQKMESLSAVPSAGDVVNEVLYSDYEDFDGLKQATRLEVRVNGETTIDIQYKNLTFNRDLPDQIFDIPQEFNPSPIVPTSSLAVEELAKDVFYLKGIGQGLYNVMFVDFDDYLVVMDAPLNSGVTESILAKVKETVPGKPIRYVVATHHHGDHLGGIRTFIAEGVTIVIAESNAKVIGEYVGATHTLFPDRLSKNTKQPKLLTVKPYRKYTLKDDHHRIDIHNLGTTPHAEGVLVAYLPDERIIFEADMYNLIVNTKIAPANDTALYFANQLKELDIKVEKIVGAHRGITTMADLNESVMLRTTGEQESQSN